ncbi:D-mandelate dehydrogenase-like dehydrogenase [Aspergillus ruber CBS 135680]|uniref:Putative NAD-dependent D-isomer specific 2-hydroxyacid dehydrogenase n=1 Tax=Aspergillus ruber (strain CBS 135680) TaxID=1388766 RepID=A0A017SS54_ASPRC|nr:putative NAD-dependent D-isomer specific 2-hydroxyacid dehydrogenase [Aspergillus ruber CBS 135680]EYE99080.1 putative NAD-dependent D-isomer specific 2-hydroxyacid dehydrogenase [Aspergillus ruber CBS 135680]
MASAALLIGAITHARKEWEDLSSFLTLKEFPSGTREDFIQNCKNGDYDDVVAIYRSNASTKFTGPFNAEMLSVLPSSLKYICHNGAGYDNVDVDACTQKGIAVSSTPVAVNNATADVGIFLMIGALRQAYVPLTSIREGQWLGKSTLGRDPQGKVLGILGMGGIGREMANRAKAFGMNIQYHNRSRLSPELEGDSTYVSFDELLATSDVLSLNLALNESTRHIIGEKEFGKMKDGIVIVNTARGALINEKALVAAVDSGKVLSAGLDVYENEPVVESGLINNPRVMLLPHIGTMTYETQKDMELLVLNNLRSAVEKGKMITLVPEQKSAFQGMNGTS